MRKIIFVIVLVAISLTGVAQIVLNHNSHAPLSGDINSYSKVTFTDPGISGKNNIWDMSNAELTGDKKVSSQYSADYSDAQKFTSTPNHVLEESGNKFFHQITDKSYAITGFLNNDFEINYLVPLTRMVYPFTYTDFIEGELKAVAYNVNRTETDISGNYKIIADATGTIILPGGKKVNVLRVVQQSTSVQVSACSEVNIESVKYMWYTSTERYPVMTTIIQQQRYCTGKVDVTEETWINDRFIDISNEGNDEISNNIFSKEELKINVFPNPFKETTQISYVLPKDSEVSLFVYDVTGNLIKEIQPKDKTKAGFYSFNLDNSDMGIKPGLYFLRLEINGNIYSEKIIRNQ